MTDDPFHDLNWWAEFIRTDVVIQNEMLTRAMCKIKGLAFGEFEAFGKLFLEHDSCRYPSAYGGRFDERFLYPLSIGFEVRVNQPPGRLELQVVDRHLYYNEKTLLVARADPQVDWNRALQNVLEDIRLNFPHVPAWQEALRIELFLEQLREPEDLEDLE